MAPPDRPQGFRQIRSGQGRDQGARPPLLHQHRLAEHLHRPALPQGLREERQIFGRGVVDLGLLHQKGLTGDVPLTGWPALCWGPARVQGVSHQEPQQVGPIEGMRPKAHPNHLGHEGRRGRELGGPARHQGQTRGGREFAGGEAGAACQRDRLPAGHLQHRGGWEGQQAVGGLHAAMAGGGDRADHRPGIQVQQPGAYPHHIHQGIEGPHLMEFHRLRGMAMDHRFGLRQALKHPQHPLP